MSSESKFIPDLDPVSERYSASLSRSQARRFEREKLLGRRQARRYVIGFFLLLAAGSWVAGGDPALSENGSSPSPSASSPSALSVSETESQLIAERKASAALRARLALERKASAATVKRLRSTLNAKPSVRSALKVSALVYGVPESQLRAVAHCESRLSASAVGRTPVGSERAVGLMQFLPSTFRRTSFGRAGLDPFDPYVSALAAGSIVQREGWRQWSCKP